MHPTPRSVRTCALLLTSLLSPLPLVAAGPAEPKLQFNRDVRPILSDTCFACHGPDEAKRKGKLRLDVREAALKGGKSGSPAILPGKPQESEILKRVTSTDREEVMPPPKDHKNLTASQTATLQRWVAEGAEYQGHWAFEKPQRPPVPPFPKNPTPPQNPEVAGPSSHPVDAFIRTRLALENLHPSPSADRAVLLRRVSLDLTGLPPTPSELETFLNDPRPDAYESAVDRLLASPRYGERMAMQWLDFARYADSNGFQSDTSREMWHWRDWLINAFNRNVPFDQFTTEQLAGDLLPSATNDQITATGFHRNHRLNGEGGRIVEEWFAENVIDRVETTGLTWLALTLNCCRCHDHKFDPISQKEFYQFFAFFNSCDESGVLGEFGGSAETRKGGNTQPVLFLPTAEEKQRVASAEKAVKESETRLAEARKLLPAAQTAWEQDFATKLDVQPWSPLTHTGARSLEGATLTAQPDGSLLASGTNPKNDTYEITAPLAQGSLGGILLEVLPDPSLPNQSLGRSSNGNFVLTGIEAEILTPGATDPVPVKFTRAQADYEQKGYEVAKLVADTAMPAKPGAKGRGKAAVKPSSNKPGWAIDGNDPAKRLPRTALFACEPQNIPAGSTLTVRLLHHSQFGDHNIGRFRLQSSGLPPALLKIGGSALPDSVRTALKLEAAKRSPAQRQELQKFYLANTDNPVRTEEAALTKLREELKNAVDSQQSTMVLKEAAKPRDAFILKRGEYDKPGDKVERGVPAALPPLPSGAPVNRLGLAQWIVSPENPLTARVWVNRAWERFFGTGLVKTSENFGSQAEWPSHPELLDWLACEFMQPTVSPAVNGQPARPWDMKALQKLLVTSATYRQSAAITKQLLERDPDNRLLARGPRFRLQGELVRDQALAVSGLLVEQLGGPSVRPYMPAGVWDETSVYGNLRNYQADKTPDGLYRRSVYTIWKRTAAPPSMLLFDSPNREICTVKRSRTNTPTQALALLNEVTFVEAARALAQRMLSEGGTAPEDRIRWAFRAVTARTPQPEEVQILVSGHTRRSTRYQQDPAAAAQLISQGASKPEARFAPAELAAYTATANVLLNLDEAVTRE